jgi:coiled-coil domain-containing protein 61
VGTPIYTHPYAAAAAAARVLIHVLIHVYSAPPNRTGNYKPYGVFTSMVKAAVARTNPSVKLELLTYSDLEALRAQKTGTTGFTGGVSTSNLLDASSTSARSSNKRYLIMTFSSEFDRVHYPLPLQYGGRPEPAQLQAVIRKLWVR